MIKIECPDNAYYGLPIPQNILNLQRVSIFSNEDSNSGLGITVGYRAHDIELTIYLYDYGVTDIPDDILNPIVREHFDVITSDVMYAGNLNGKILEILSRYATGSPAFGLEFLCATFIGQDEISPLMTFALVAAKSEKFVKLRLTSRQLPEQAAVRMREVVDAYADSLWPRHELLRASSHVRTSQPM